MALTPTYGIQIRGTAERRNVRAEVLHDGRVIARSGWVALAAGETAPVRVTVDAAPGTYELRQVTNVGSNIHEDLTAISLGTLRHG